MRSLSFLLVTYYAVLRLFVTQIVPDVYPPPSTLPFRPFAVLGRLKIAWLAKTRGEKRSRDGTSDERGRLLIKAEGIK